MFTVLIISVVIVLVVLILAVVTTSKAYTYKHTIDSIEDVTSSEEYEINNKDSKD